MRLHGRAGAARAGHAQVVHDVEHAFHAGADRALVEAQRFTGFVGDHRNALGLGHFAQGALAEHRVDHHRHAERGGHGGGVLVGEVGADLRQVGAVDGAGVQVHRVGGAVQHLGLELPGHARAQAAGFRAGERAVEITAVGQVPGLVNKAEHIDHRHRQQGAVKPVERRMTQQPADDFHAVQLITVDRRAHQQHRPRPPPVDHMNRHVQRRLRIKLRQRQLHLDPGTRHHPRAVQLKRRRLLFLLVLAVTARHHSPDSCFSFF